MNKIYFRYHRSMKKVYVAGKLNADAVGYLFNCHKMLETAELLREAGYSVFVPCLDLIMGIKFGWENYEEYFNNSQPWLQAADAVFLVPGWETSTGTAKEIATAQSCGIPVFDRLDEMWSHFEGVPGGAIVDITRNACGAAISIKKERNLTEEEKVYDAARA